MKRFIIGAGWFIVINVAFGFISGIFESIVGVALIPDANIEKGLFTAVALLIAVIGTLTGKLPYTKK